MLLLKNNTENYIYFYFFTKCQELGKTAVKQYTMSWTERCQSTELEQLEVSTEPLEALQSS